MHLKSKKSRSENFYRIERTLENTEFSRVFLLNFPEKHTKNTQTAWERLIMGGTNGSKMGKSREKYI